MTTFNVYRRNTVSDTPIAIATGLISKNYSDTTAVAGNTYLYSIGAVKNGIEKIGDEVSVEAASYWNFSTLVLNFDSLPFVDSSISPKTISNYGVTTASGKFGLAADFPNTTNHLTVPATCLNAVGSGDFTIAFWVYTYAYGSTDGSQPWLNSGTILGRLNDESDFYMFFGIGSGGITLLNRNVYTDLNVAPDLNAWNFIEIGRKDGILRCFKDGVLGYSGADTSSLNIRGDMYIGCDQYNTRKLNARLDDFIILSSAWHTSDYTVPTTPFPTS